MAWRELALLWAARECRVQEAGAVRSWLASAFGEAVPAGPLAAAVGRAID